MKISKKIIIPMSLCIVTIAAILLAVGIKINRNDASDSISDNVIIDNADNSLENDSNGTTDKQENTNSAESDTDSSSNEEQADEDSDSSESDDEAVSEEANSSNSSDDSGNSGGSSDKNDSTSTNNSSGKPSNTENKGNSDSSNNSVNSSDNTGSANQGQSGSTGTNTDAPAVKPEANKQTLTMEMNSEGIYAVDNNYFKSISPLDEKSVVKVSEYINNIKKNILTENNKTFYAIIPDKTYYDTSNYYDKLDYDKMVDIMSKNISGSSYIALKDLLTLDDYYKTDNHWRQENIFAVANRIGSKLGFSVSKSNFTEKSYSSFRGMYSKYIVDTNYTETLKYLVNNTLTNAVADNLQDKNVTSVYKTSALGSEVSYDVYLSGATPLITITNSSQTNNKELVIFRDSFGSSLVPLFISEYSKITMIDTRYMFNAIIKDYVEFSNQDVLFLYSSAVVNKSGILK